MLFEVSKETRYFEILFLIVFVQAFAVRQANWRRDDAATTLQKNWRRQSCQREYSALRLALGLQTFARRFFARQVDNKNKQKNKIKKT